MEKESGRTWKTCGVLAHRTQFLHTRHFQPTAGFILPVFIVFAAVFLTIGTGLVNYLLTVQRAEQNRITDELAFDIAEAGLNYYSWYLGRFLSGGGANVPTVAHPIISIATTTYADTNGADIGSYGVTAVGNFQCGVLQSIDITSTAYASSSPSRIKGVTSRYAQQTVANYSSVITGTPVRYISSVTTHGRIHSKYGIRMDGTSLSTIESEVNTWNCTSAYGCSPEQPTANGVVGSGSGSSLWKWGSSVRPMTIAPDFSLIKNAVQVSGGNYFAPTGILHGGYHLTFNSGGTFTVQRVTAVNTSFWGVSFATGSGIWGEDDTLISSQTVLGTYAIPSSCSVIYVDDNAWVDGTIKGKVSVVSSANILLPSNVTYAAYDGTNGFVALANNSVLVTLDSPDTMTLNGVYAAINGSFSRNLYLSPGGAYGAPYVVPSQYSGANGVYRTSLTLNGVWVSRGIPGMWSDPWYTGFITRNYLYDGTFAGNTPPFAPTTTSQYSFISWQRQ